MAAVEELVPGVLVKGLLPRDVVSVVSVKRHGSVGVELFYQDANGQPGSELLYQEDVASRASGPWRIERSCC